MSAQTWELIQRRQRLGDEVRRSGAKIKEIDSKHREPFMITHRTIKHTWRKLQAQIAQALAKDKENAYHKRLGEAAEALKNGNPAPAQRITKLYKRSAKGNKHTAIKPLHPDAASPERAAEGWLVSFAGKEAATIQTSEQAQEACIARQNANRWETPQPDMTKCPTKHRIRNIYAKTPHNKQTGPEQTGGELLSKCAEEMAAIATPLLTKCHVRTQEPWGYKGGVAAPLPKSASTTNMDNFRSVLLSSPSGKTRTRHKEGTSRVHSTNTSETGNTAESGNAAQTWPTSGLDYGTKLRKHKGGAQECYS